MRVTTETTLASIAAASTLTAASAAFLAAPVEVNAADTSYACGLPALYVGQGEVAYSFAAAPMVLATDDATTCCIVVLEGSNCYCLAHVDSPSQVDFLFDHWASMVGTVDTQVAVVGGYCDERSIGAKIVNSILAAMRASPTVFSISLWVTGAINTVTGSRPAQPKARGLAVVPLPTATGFLRFNAVEFAPGASRGPAFLRRMTSTPQRALHVLNAAPALQCFVGPYVRAWLECSAEDAASYLAFAQRATDAQILAQFSTSPQAEGPKFVADIKERFAAAVDLAHRSSAEQRAALAQLDAYSWDAAAMCWRLDAV
ncbi:hypothetical protein ACHHYP_08119 [Achlya hypogyna]|uniref:Secreted protein n=1 Tax=Achlya hypogyna TaxID=1202772 RepID=A0A1V9YPR9_ACHHY|nr:hypothetical protein ACHHYP_08119 [Achlya hypogyna]